MSAATKQVPFVDSCARLRMQRLPVKSSNLKSVGYDPQSGTMEIEFQSGEVHQYQGVLPHQHSALMAAPSAGAYFHRFIKAAHPGKKLKGV